MKNLKRALSFALATVMVIGMMVVGASAADFGDADKIVNTEAVNTMSALNIINGRDNGDFDPEGVVTRAEMAKMICVALNGGKDPNLTSAGKYTDTKGHWAAGYIDYCANLGIVSGNGDGTFNPQGTVTGTQAAKMILIALGYNAESEKFVNDTNWALNIDVIANQKGLYEDLAILPSEGLTRDNAAQMIYNGLQAEKVSYTYQLNTIDGNLVSVAVAQGNGLFLINEKFGLRTQKGYLSKVTYNATKEEYTYTVLDDGTPITTAPAGVSVSVTDKADFTDLYGDYVKMLYKNTANGRVLYGIYSASDDSLTVKRGDMTVTGTNDYFKIGTTKYTVSSASVNALPVYFGTAAQTDNGNFTNATTADTLKFIDVDGDSDFDYAVMVESTVAKVTFVGKDTVTIGTASYDLEDDVASIYDGVAKNDYAVVTKNDFVDTYTIEKAEVITGKIAAVKDTNTVQVAGKWYKKGATPALNSTDIGKTYELAIVGNYYYDKKITLEEGVTSDVLYISATNDISTSLGTTTVKAKAYFTDGSSEVITISKIDDTTPAKGLDLGANTTALEAVGGTNNDYLDAGTIVAGAMYRFVKTSDGNYKLYTLASTDDVTKAGYGIYDAKSTGTTTKYTGGTTKKLTVNGTNYTIADDAVIFVQTTAVGSKSIEVISGKTLKTWASDFGGNSAADTAIQVLANKVNGFDTVRVATLVDKAETVISGAADLYYGYITSTPYIADNADGDKCVVVTVWTADGEKTIEIVNAYDGVNDNQYEDMVAGSTLADYGLAQKAFIEYELDNDGYATKARTVGSKYAVTALDGKNLELDGTAAKIDDDTVFVYINSADIEGVEGGELVMANETAIAGVYVKNVVAAVADRNLNAGETLTVIFVDIANNLDNSSACQITALTDGTNAATINQTTKVIDLHASYVGTGEVNDGQMTTAAHITVSAGASYEIINKDGGTAANLEAGDTIIVVAADGTTVTYTIVA